jgi:hypothetical protein
MSTWPAHSASSFVTVFASTTRNIALLVHRQAAVDDERFAEDERRFGRDEPDDRLSERGCVGRPAAGPDRPSAALSRDTGNRAGVASGAVVASICCTFWTIVAAPMR